MRGRVTIVVLLALLLAGCTGGSFLKPATAPPPVPGALRAFDLYVHEFRWTPQPGRTLGFLAFSTTAEGGASVPGPEIRVRQGDHVRVTLHDAQHTLHWHGYPVPWAMDGVPWVTQKLGGFSESYTYDFFANVTGTYWYHCHVDAPLHVDEGMFGAFIVTPRDAAVDPPFTREATLFLHDADSAQATHNPLLAPSVGDSRDYAGNLPASPAGLPRFGEDTAQQGVDVAGDAAGGATGQWTLGSAGPRDYYPTPSVRYQPRYDTFMINAKTFPYTAPLHVNTGDVLRIRIINAGQLVHTMHLHGHVMLVTHKDGHKLASPYEADTVGLFPGERYDVYVKADNAGMWDLHDHGGSADGMGAYASDQGVFPGGMATMLVYDDFALAKSLPAPSGESRDYLLVAQRWLGLP